MSEAFCLETPEQKPNLSLLHGENEDVIDLLPIDLIDLEPIRRGSHWDFKGTSQDLQGRDVVRYISEACEGSMSDKEFEKTLRLATGKMLEGVSTDDLSNLYDFADEQHPRVTQLLQRIRSENLYATEHHVAITKLTLLFTGYRHIDELK